MAENTPEEPQLPFEVVADEEGDMLDLTIDVELKKPASKERKQELENLMVAWAEKGIDEGYGNDRMGGFDEEENEWDQDDRRLRFWVDMGRNTGSALEVLYSDLANSNDIERVRLGSRYHD